MKRISILFTFSLSLSSCYFTSQVLKDQTKASAIPSNSYSLNRAYYSNDGLLHIDFLNDQQKHRKKMNYYSVSINIYGILSEYNQSNKEIVDFDSKTTRFFGATSAARISKSCNCTEAYNYRSGVEINLKEMRVDYLSELPYVDENKLLKSVSTIDVNCCWAMTGEDIITNENGEPVEPVNKPLVLFIIPVAKQFGTYVALRIPLRGHKTKLDRLSVALLLDVVTSPVQFGLEILKKKSDSIDAVNGRKP